LDFLECERFCLVELGAGDGSLAEQVLRAMEEKWRQKRISYYLVEVGAGREMARRRLSRFPRVRFYESLSELEHIPGVEGCVLSNEFFDALPFHRVIWLDGRLRELYVKSSARGLVEEEGPPSTPALESVLREQRVVLAEGQKAEIRLSQDEAVSEIARILSRGFVLSIDYGEPSLDLYRPHRTEGTLQVYEKHRREESPFENLGERDMTAFVDFGRLADVGRRHGLEPLIFAPQGAFLLNSGEKILRPLVENEVGKRHNLAVAGQIQQLVHPETFGGRFQVLVQGKNVANAALSGGKINRIHRLGLSSGHSSEGRNSDSKSESASTADRKACE
jgi:SAM-dependent MidA family methyltransferase